jgi:predicted metal-dependent peptidase
MKALEVLAAGRLIARKKAPYFRAALLGLVPEECPGLGTVGVTADAVLLFDPAFVEAQSPEAVAGLLVHEVMHLVLAHGARINAQGLDKVRANKAADLAINPSIVGMGFDLPEGEYRGMFPKDFGWSDGLTMNEYYDLLTQQEQAEKQQGQGSEKSDGSEGQGSGSAKGHAAHGRCGSCAGEAHEQEKHIAPGTGRSEQEVARIARTVAESVREHAAKSRGSVPASVARWAEKALEPSKVPWQQKLARLTRMAVAWRAGAVDHRYDAPGRRQAGLGYGVGRPVMPRLRQPVPEALIVVDTSGSMGSKELGEAAREAHAVLRAVGGSCTFATCDARVQGISKARSLDDILGSMTGGGGTDMRPAFEAAAKLRPRPEIVVVLTDGLVDDGVPASEPPWCKTIWVGVGPSKRRPAPWGEYIEVD